MKLSWHILVIVSTVGLQYLNVFTSVTPVRYAAYGAFVISVLQAVHTLAAKYDNPPK